MAHISPQPSSGCILLSLMQQLPKRNPFTPTTVGQTLIQIWRVITNLYNNCHSHL